MLGYNKEYLMEMRENKYEMDLSYFRKSKFFMAFINVNIVGTIYGYVWYRWQLVETPAIFLPFVPDSPTASLFFVFVLVAFLIGKNWPFDGGTCDCHII